MIRKIKIFHRYIARKILRLLAKLISTVGINSKMFGPPNGYYYSIDELYESSNDKSKIVFKELIDGITIEKPFNSKYLKEINLTNELTFQSVNLVLNSLDNGRFHLNPLAVISSNDKLIFSESCCYGMNPEEHWIFNRMKLSKCTELPGKAFMLGGRANHWHLLSEELPKLYRLAKNNININDFDYLLIESFKYETQKQIYDLFEIDTHKFIPLHENNHVKSDNLYFFSPSYQPDIKALSWVRDTVLSKIRPEKTSSRNLFISRQDCRTKRIYNFTDEFYKLLKKYDFEIIKPEIMSFEQQVNKFYNSNFIIGAHGGALGNLMFCSSLTNVIELRSFLLEGSFAAPNVCQWYQALNNLKYSVLPCKIKENHSLKGRSKVDSDFIIDTLQLERLIQFHLNSD